MANVAQAWAEEYAKVRPAISVEVSGGGSATGFAALIDGSADLANCSRGAGPEEIEAARKKTGKPLREWIAGYDALAVYVHRDNPIEEISLPQLADIYGSEGTTLRWSLLGASQSSPVNDRIILISRQSNSGTYEYFRHAILGPRGDIRLGTRDLNGSKEVVTLIGTTPAAIGYSGMGYATPDVKMLRVARTAGRKAFAPTAENVSSGEYPIARPLYIYSLGEPRGAVAEYLSWILSAAGQRVVAASGYVPVRGVTQTAGRLR